MASRCVWRLGGELSSASGDGRRNLGEFPVHTKLKLAVTAAWVSLGEQQ